MRARHLLLTPVLVFALGCREDRESPTAPEPTAAATAAAQALRFRQVSAGGRHGCGITRDDLAYCWGFNWAGQLGDGTTGDHFLPIAVQGGHRFKHVNVGYDHSCGVTTSNRAFCWGYNGSGQLGDGTTTNRSTPRAVAGGRAFRQVRAGAVHTCAITTSDVAFCWGAPGRLGEGTNNQRLKPAKVLGDTSGVSWAAATGTPAASRRTTRPTAGATTAMGRWATAPRGAFV